MATLLCSIGLSPPTLADNPAGEIGASAQHDDSKGCRLGYSKGCYRFCLVPLVAVCKPVSSHLAFLPLDSTPLINLQGESTTYHNLHVIFAIHKEYTKLTNPPFSTQRQRRNPQTHHRPRRRLQRPYRTRTRLLPPPPRKRTRSLHRDQSRQAQGQEDRCQRQRGSRHRRRCRLVCDARRGRGRGCRDGG